MWEVNSKSLRSCTRGRSGRIRIQLGDFGSCYDGRGQNDVIPYNPDHAGQAPAQLLQVRAAEERDAKTSRAFTRKRRRTTLPTFEHFLVTPEERTRWVTEHSGKYPMLVAELNGRVLGWASLSPIKCARASMASPSC